MGVELIKLGRKVEPASLQYTDVMTPNAEDGVYIPELSGGITIKFRATIGAADILKRRHASTGEGFKPPLESDGLTFFRSDPLPSSRPH